MKAILARALVLASPCLAMAQIASLQIKVIDGEGSAHPLGARVMRPLTVEVTDEAGKPVAGAAVSFQLPPQGPSGLFANGLRTDLILADSSGRASIHSIQLNRVSGPLHIRITAVKEQARAGIVCTQSIAEGPGGAVPGPATPAQAPPASVPAPVPTPVNPAPAQSTASSITPNTAPTTAANPAAHTAKSGEITPTTVKMGSGSHKKWILIAVIAAAGAGVAFVGVSHAKSSSSSQSTVSSSTVSIGTPVITIGNP